MPQNQFTPSSDYVSEKRKKYDARYKNQNLKNNYNVGAKEYPQGLRTKPDLQHYVAFYINVRDKSRSGANNPKNKDYLVSKEEQKRVNLLNEDKSSRLRQTDINAGVNTAKKYAGTLAAGAYVLGKLGLGTRLRDLPRLAGETLAVAGVAKLGAKMLDAAKLQNFQSGGTSRLKEVITLHMEDRPSVKYGTKYTTRDMGFITGLLIQGSAAETANQIKQMEPEIQARVLSQIAKMPVINNLRELSTRETTNPFREVLFESVDYRAFNFRYRFFPKNAAESQAIFKIIETFKIHMHPELTGGKLFYLYPSEFDIQYFYKDKENDYLHRFARCALTDLQVDYGGEQFATFEDGSPVEIGMMLTFHELEQMTSEGIEQHGY
jgi:hypothetical protein